MLLKNGAIVEQGTREQLMACEGEFHKLVVLQMTSGSKNDNGTVLSDEPAHTGSGHDPDV